MRFGSLAPGDEAVRYIGIIKELYHACLIPTQIITFLGFVIDSTVEAVSLPREKVVKVKSFCLKAKVSRTIPAGQITSVLGTQESYRNLPSSPSFSILANQNDPSSTFEQPELRSAYYSGSRLFGRTSLVGVQHQPCERQPNKASSSNVFLITTDASKTGFLDALKSGS